MIKLCKEFYPSREDCKDLYKYLKSIEREAREYGICKIIPPIPIKPIKITEKFSVREQELKNLNINKRVSVFYLNSLLLFYEFNCNKFTKNDIQNLVNKYNTEIYKFKHKTQSFEYLKYLKDYEHYINTLKNTYADSIANGVKANDVMCIECGIHVNYSTDIDKSKFYCPNCIQNYSVAFDTLPHLFSFNEFVQKYSSASSKEDLVEREYWKLLNSSDNDTIVYYGSDLQNVSTNNCLSSLSSLLNSLSNINGMTIPWVYVGMKYSTFCYHTEDHYTPSINYLHFGSTKTWYSIPHYHQSRFESYLRKTYPSLFALTPDLLQHMTTVVDPTELVSNGIHVFTARQRQGEYIVTWPKAYHSGFNHGINIAEAVNFAYEHWLYDSLDCDAVYASCSRPPVFSTEKLIYDLHTDPQFCDFVENSFIVSDCLRLVLEREQKNRSSGQFLLNSNGDSNVAAAQTHDDVKQCCKCHAFLYFSFLYENSKLLRKRKRSHSSTLKFYCYDHAPPICQICFVYSNNYIDSLYSSLE